MKTLLLLAATMPAFLSAPAQAQARWQPESGDVIAFDVTRNGERFGSHIVRFEAGSDTLTVVSDVDLKAGFGPFTLYRYSLDSEETWMGGELIHLKAQTNDDGDRVEVVASASGETLQVKGSAFSGAVSQPVLPSSHWNFDVIGASTMLSTQDGSLLDVTITPAGPDAVTVGGQTIEATRYDVAAKLPYSLWYDSEGRWVKLAFQARGQQIEYTLRALY